jgi:Tfp pilus assembly protein PilF
MSLLLDALKKSGSAQHMESSGHSAPGGLSGMPPASLSGMPPASLPGMTPGSLSGMTLEELPNKPMAAAPSAGTVSSPSPRSTGENLFAAKQAPARKKFTYNLGIVPTASIIGLVLGTAGGIYVWYEIQPPKQVLRSSPPPVMAANIAPAPYVPLALPPASLPAASPPVAETPSKIVPQTVASANSVRSGSTRRAAATQAGAGIEIQRQSENDGIFSTLTAAYQAYQSGDLGTAWQRYREVLQKDPKNRDALLGMAAIAQQQGQDDAAMQYYRQVLLLDPRDPVAQAGMSAFSTGDAAGKESRLKLSLAQAPQSAALHFALGNLYTEQSRWGDAQQAYFNAIRLEPANAQFAFNLATSLDHLGQRKLAAQYYGLALQTDTTGNAGFDRAQTQQRLNQLSAP